MIVYKDLLLYKLYKLFLTLLSLYLMWVNERLMKIFLKKIISVYSKFYWLILKI